MKNNARYQRIVYLIGICDTEAFAADKNVGFFSLKRAISRSLKDANDYLTLSGAKRRIERITREGHFSSDYYFNVTEYDRQTGILTNIAN